MNHQYTYRKGKLKKEIVNDTLIYGMSGLLWSFVCFSLSLILKLNSLSLLLFIFSLIFLFIGIAGIALYYILKA